MFSAGRDLIDAPFLWVVRILVGTVVCGHARSAGLGQPQRLGFPSTRSTACASISAPPLGRRRNFPGFFYQPEHVVRTFAPISSSARWSDSEHAFPYLCSGVPDFLSWHL